MTPRVISTLMVVAACARGGLGEPSARDGGEMNREDSRRPRRAVRGRLYPAMSLALALVFAGGAAGAVETTVVVRAKAKDAMFIGSSFGGARVVVRNAETGEILAQGLTEGGTGAPDVVMAETIRRGATVTDARTARFKAVLNLNEPTLATIEVVAPRSQGQAMIRASTQVWLIPGKELGVDGLILEIRALRSIFWSRARPGRSVCRTGKPR